MPAKPKVEFDRSREELEKVINFPYEALLANLTYIVEKTGKSVMFRVVSMRELRTLVTQDIPSSDSEHIEVLWAKDNYIESEVKLERDYCYVKFNLWRDLNDWGVEGHAYIKDLSERRHLGALLRNLLINFVYLGYNSTEQVLAFEFLVKNAIPLFDFPQPTSKRDRRTKIVEFLTSTCLSALAQEKENVIYSITQLERNIADYETALIEKVSQVQSEREQLRVAEEILERQDSSFAKNEINGLELLIKSGSYENFQVLRGKLIGRTSPIVIDYDNFKFPVGQFEVIFSPGNRLTARGLNKPSTAFNPHPHVSKDGIFCWGNATADVSKMIGLFQVSQIFALAYSLLNSYSPSNPYERIDRFDPSGDYTKIKEAKRIEAEKIAKEAVDRER